VVKRLVALGGAKFNVSTDLKYALIDATYEYISRTGTNTIRARSTWRPSGRSWSGSNYWIDLLGCE
jgi:fructose/tagatose bisphosphate aldolase